MQTPENYDIIVLAISPADCTGLLFEKKRFINAGFSFGFSIERQILMWN